MSKYVGVDWAGNGWFGVVLHDDGDWDADCFPSILSVWNYHSDAERILVDIPIGLPGEDGPKRQCDVDAKSLLGERHQSVFYAPIRPAVYETNLEAARERNEPAGFSIQNQAWGIVPRIREVDEFLDTYPGARDRFRETHPEVCFHSLNDGAIEHSKQTEAGQRERLAVLAAEYPQATDIYDEVVESFTTPDYAPLVSGRDDLLDALVAAFTAAREERKLETLPEAPPTDRRGLPMEIVYPTSAVQTTLSALSEDS